MRNRALKTASIGAVALMFAVSSQAFAQEFLDGEINVFLDRTPILKSGGDGTQTNDLQKTLTMPVGMMAPVGRVRGKERSAPV